MKIYYSDTHSLHNPPFEVFDGGEKVPYLEMPGRMAHILKSLEGKSWAEIHPPFDFGLEPVLAVHDEGYVQFLKTAFDDWMREQTAYERTALLPATFPPAGWRRKPETLLGRAGYYMMDLSAPILAGTFHAALQSANCALSGAQTLKSGARSAFALCRPPGHHAGRANCGGYCYLNNAAIAANWLSQNGKVAVLDIDYHAGNGTQDIFYERQDVLTISLHADPAYEYPYYSGYADETGSGAGMGWHRNYPLPAGTDDAGYLVALSDALGHISDFAPDWLVLSAGMDIYCEDPLGKFNISRGGLQQIGKMIGHLDVPVLVVMEGGYNNAQLGENMTALLEQLQ